MNRRAFLQLARGSAAAPHRADRARRRRRLRLLVHPPEVRIRRLGRRPAHAGEPASRADRLHHACASIRRNAWSPLADPTMLRAPFCYLAGHKLVEFNPDERRNFEQYVRNGGFVLVDDCNHDIDGLFAKSFENADGGDLRRRRAEETAEQPRDLLAASSHFDGPPTTGVRAQRLGRRPRPRLPQGHRDRRPPRRALQQQGLRLRVGLRLAQQALAGRGQHQVRGQHRRSMR